MDLPALPRRPRALVLEPESGLARDLAAVLAGAGFLVERAERPGMASAHLQVAEDEQQAFELLILPTQLQGLSGLDLALTLAARLRTPPGMLLTSGPYSAPGAEELERCAAPMAIVMLPMRADQMRAALSAVVPAQRLVDAARAQVAGLLAL